MSSNNIAIYVRESRDDNGEDFETIETQKDLLVDYVNKSNLGNIYDIYMDDNVSGSAFKREALGRLENDIKNGSVNLLIVKDLSRLGRNNAKTLLFLDFIEEYGVRLLTFDGKYDSLKDNDTVGIETWFNERYIRDISKKIRANIKFKIQKGEYIGSAPFGYVKSQMQKNRLNIDESTSFIVREIFELYLKGLGLKQITDYLGSKKYPTPSKKSGSEWNRVAVSRILSNRVYIGDTVQGVSEKISFKSKKTRRLPSQEWIITPSTHEPVIEKELFDQVQKLLKSKKPSGGYRNKIHLFRGLLYCGKCGSSMLARTRKDRPLGYLCGNYMKNGKEFCSSHHINEQKILNSVKNEITVHMNNQDVKNEVIKQLSLYIEQKSKSGEAARLKGEISDRKRKQDILYMDRLEGKISSELFQRTNTLIEADIIFLKTRLARAKEYAGGLIRPEEIYDDFMNCLEILSLSNLYLKILIKKIAVCEPGDKTREINSKGGIIIDFNFKKV